MASATWPGGIPTEVAALRRRTRGPGHRPRSPPIGQGVPVPSAAPAPSPRWEQANVVRGVANGTVSATAWSRLGDVTAEQFRAIAAIGRELRRRGPHHQPPELRAPRPDARTSCPRCTSGSRPSAWPSPAPSWPATWSPAPGRTPATWRSPRAGGWPRPSARRSRPRGWPRSSGVRTNISGCTNSCGQHHVADIGFFGAERRAHGRSAPGYQMLLGRLRRRRAGRVRPEGPAPAGQGRPRGRGAGRGPLRRRARARRGLRGVAGARGWGQGGRPRDSRTSTSSPRPRTTRTSTSTSARPAPTRRRSATRSARYELRRQRPAVGSEPPSGGEPAPGPFVPRSFTDAGARGAQRRVRDRPGLATSCGGRPTASGRPWPSPRR